MTPPLCWTNAQRPVITHLASLASLAPKVNVWSQRQTRDLRLAPASLSNYCNRSRLTSPQFGWGWSGKRGKGINERSDKGQEVHKGFFLIFFKMCRVLLPSLPLNIQVLYVSSSRRPSSPTWKEREFTCDFPQILWELIKNDEKKKKMSSHHRFFKPPI